MKDQPPQLKTNKNQYDLLLLPTMAHSLTEKNIDIFDIMSYQFTKIVITYTKTYITPETSLQILAVTALLKNVFNKP